MDFFFLNRTIVRPTLTISLKLHSSLYSSVRLKLVLCSVKYVHNNRLNYEL